MSDAPVLMLLDGHSLAYRAFYALPEDLRTRTGQQTNAVYGFTSMLIKVWSDRRPDRIVVTFDQGRDVARTAVYPEYKATREAAPDTFRTQVDLIRQVLDALRIPVVSVAGVEADDLIATLADQGTAQGYEVLVVTGDRDAMQLVRDDVTVLYNTRGVSETRDMTPEGVVERYGVRPDQYVLYAALRGDTSDNLPGVPGVGEKTAAKLLGRFGDFDTMFANLDQVGGKKVPAMLAEHEPQVRTNAQVMALRHDVGLETDLADLDLGEIDADAVRALFGTLEFRALYDRFVSDVLGDVEQEQAEDFARDPVRLGPGGLAGWLEGIAGPLAVVPFTSDRVPHLRLDALAVAADGRDPASIRSADLDAADEAALTAALADPELALVGHDVKRLLHVATGRGWDVAGVVLDTELAAYLLNPEQRSFDLERLAVQHLSRTFPEVADDGGGTQDQLALEVPDEDPWEERALRAEATRQLAAHLAGQLDERDQRELLETVELPLLPLLQQMEAAGIAVDPHVFAELHDRLAARAVALEAEVHALAGREFRIGSGPQLQQVLFEELGLTRTRRIKTGWSTDATELTKLVGEHDIVEAVLEWREVTKLLSTYVDALPREVDDATGRIHTTLSQTTAATGRLASSEPNLQNVPVRTAEGREIRRGFVAGEGFSTFLVADYSQIELRVMAHLSGDEGLLGAFASEEDIHATTAAAVFDLPLEAVDGALRDRAKAVNYGLAYGLTPFGLSQQLAIPPDEAREIVDAYMTRFPGISQFLGRAVEDARRDGYTTTIFGRRRYLPDLMSTNRNRRQMAERMALNAPIQGTAADIIKLAMVRVGAALRAADVRSRMLLQVHDEIVLECAPGEEDDVEQLVLDAMSGVADLAVPLEVDTARGVTWFDAQKH